MRYYSHYPGGRSAERMAGQEESAQQKQKRRAKIQALQNSIEKSFIHSQIQTTNMAINATTAPREIMPAGNHIARCYMMLEIGTVEENIQGETKIMRKCLIGWEVPGELNSYGEPHTINQEYTLSMSEKSNLRKMLISWRGIDFKAHEVPSFDITKLLTVPCMLNVIHKASRTSGNNYATISGVTRLPKSVVCPDQVNDTTVLQYDKWDDATFEALPEFIRKKIEGSVEYQKLHAMQTAQPDTSGKFAPVTDGSDLPF